MTTALLLKTADKKGMSQLLSVICFPRTAVICFISPQFISSGFVLSGLIWALNISKGGGSTASLGNLLQSSTILTAKKGFDEGKEHHTYQCEPRHPNKAVRLQTECHSKQQ